MFNEKNIYNLFVEADSLDNDLSHLKFEIQKNDYNWKIYVVSDIREWFMKRIIYTKR